MALHVRASTAAEHDKVERLARARAAPVRLVTRARIIQLAAAGWMVPAIAPELDVSEKTVRLWLKRFEVEGLEGLEDAPRSGRPPTDRPDVTNQVIAKARSLPPTPAEGEVPPPATRRWIASRRSWPRTGSPSSAARSDACSRPST